MRTGRRDWFIRVLSQIGLLSMALTLMAPAALATLSQSYASTTPIPAGSLVALDEKSPGSVVVATVNNSERLFGVVVTPSAASVSLGGSGNGQVQVGTTGSASALVSTAGGDIHVGDYIAISPIAGVGQKAVGKVRVLGTAQVDFNAGTTGTTKQTIDVEGGGKKEVTIGQIPVVIAVATYNSNTGAQDYVIPVWLQNISNAVAGKSVSPIRVIIASMILLVALVSITVLLYAAVRNSIISIGRNPLSRGSVLRGLLEVIGVAAIILIIAAGAMYVVIAR